MKVGDLLNRMKPIKDKELVKDIGYYLKNKSEKLYIMYLIGIYSGIRITDILDIKVRSVRNKDVIRIVEKKTKKLNAFPVNKFLKKELNRYIDDNYLEDYDYLIQREQGHNDRISRQYAHKVMKEAAMYFGLDKIGTHSLRKTFAYHYYKQYDDLKGLQVLLNHSDISETKRYIDIDQEEAKEKAKKLKFF